MKKIFLKILSLTILIAAVDQAVKFFIENSHQEWISKNTGIALGINMGEQWAIIIANAILMLIVIYAIKKELKLESLFTQIFSALILGGGIGNLIDRIFRGYVVDYISIWVYPSFNIADICISIGIIGIIVFFNKIKR